MIEYKFEFNGCIKNIISISEPQSTFAFVKHNYKYEDTIPDIEHLINAAKLMEPSQNIVDTHDLIAVFMMSFNKVCAPLVPIYRNCVEVQNKEGAYFNYELQAFTASYDVVNRGHATTGGTAYTHITSPIRRMADLVNMTAILYGSTHPFVQKWVNNISIMNDYCKQARKAQQNADLYRLLSENVDNMVFTGIYVKNSGVVYLKDLRLFVYIGNQEVPEGESLYQIYMFHKEFTLKRKIRLMPFSG